MTNECEMATETEERNHQENSEETATDVNVDLPALRSHDRTPVPKPSTKRAHTELSPISHADEQQTDTWKSIEEAIKTSIEAAIRALIQQILNNLKERISETVDTAVAKAKEEILESVAADMTIERKAELQSQCEAEQLETYNRRNNLKIFNKDEKIRKDTNGFPIPEPPESTINSLANYKELRRNCRRQGYINCPSPPCKEGNKPHHRTVLPKNGKNRH